MKAREITTFMHGKSATIVALILAFVSCVVAWQQGAVHPNREDLGVGFPSANLAFSSAQWSAIVNVCFTAVIALMMLYINRWFNVLRSLTSLVATMFLVMQAAIPSVLGQFYGGTAVALLTMVCTMILFSSYDNRQGQSNIFLIFFLFTAAAFTQVGYLFYLPAMLIGTVQMRVFSLRTFLAALLGVITPIWILFGIGIVTVDNLQWPGLAFRLWHLFDNAELIPTFATIGFTIALGVGFTVANLMKILSYNARIRAFNGFFTMLLVYTAMLVLLNFGNFMFYLPLLNCLVAYQIGHYFTYRRTNHSFIAIFFIMACYIALYVWSILV